MSSKTEATSVLDALDADSPQLPPVENGGDENGKDEKMVTPPKSKEKRKNDSNQTPPAMEELPKSDSPRPVATPPPSKRPRRSVTQPKPKEPEPKKEEKKDPKKVKAKPTPKKATSPSRSKKKEEKKVDEEKEVFIDCEYLKGEFIAVRSEDKAFYLAECSNNIQEKDLEKPFKVQWFDVTEEENVYVRSYHDLVDHRTVICSEVKLKKESGGKWRLNTEMVKKIKKRLDRALCGNPLTSSDESDIDDDLPLRLPGSIQEGNKVHRKFNSKKKPKSKFGPRKPVGIPGGADSPKPYLAPITVGTTARAGLKMVVENKPTGKKSSTPRKLDKGKSGGGVINQKTQYEKTPANRRGRPPIHDTAYIPNNSRGGSGDVDMSDKNGEVVELELSEPAANEQPPSNPDINLKPNLNIQPVDNDPAFSASGNPFNLPKEVLGIKSMLQRDYDALKKLISPDDAPVNSTFSLQGYRCPDVPRTVLHFALQSNDEEFVKLILGELDSHRETPAESNDHTILKSFIPADDGDAEAGNRALVKKNMWRVDWRSSDVAAEIATYACREGCTPEVLNLLIENYPKISGATAITMRELLIERVYQALECGNIKTALYLVECSNQMKQSPCSFTDLQHVTLTATGDREYPANMPVKGTEIRKKELTNMRITAMHTAAANPNGGFLKRLLEILPESLNNSDERGRRPIHYAAASSSTEPLHVLFKRKDLNIDEVDKNGMTPLMITAQLGRINNTTILLTQAKKASGINQARLLVNRVDNSNYTSLHYAAENGHEEVINLLARWGADLDKVLSIRRKRLTPLMLAARSGHIKAVNQLVDHEARIEMKDVLGRTALMHAALNGHYPIVAYLLNKGSNPNTADASGNSPLHYAAAYGWYHVVQLLLQGGASTDVVNSERISPMAVAVLKYHDDVAQLLFNHGADPNISDNQKRTLLMLLALQSPDPLVTERIEYLLDHFSPSPNVQDIHGLTVLHHIASVELPKERQEQLVPIAKLLLNGGADLNIKDYAARTPIFQATKSENIPLINFFITKGAACPESRATDDKGENMLHNMVRMWKQGDMAQIVIRLAVKSPTQVADLTTTKSRSGFTPLLLAAKIMAESVEDASANGSLLAQRGADLLNALICEGKSDPSAVVSKSKYTKANVHFEEGRSAAHYLATGANITILRALLNHKPRLDCLDMSGLSPLTAALDGNRHQAAIALLDGGARVDYCSNQPEKHKFNLAPLVFACKRHGTTNEQNEQINLMPAIKAMLEKIENINEVAPCPTTKMTPLMFACQAAQDPILVKFLLNHLSDVNVKDINAQTALHHAVVNTVPNTQVSETVELLLAASSNPTAKDNKDQTPLHLVFCREGHDPMELLSLLTENINDSSVDLVDEHGQSALHGAGNIGACACILRLKKIGANIDLKDKVGNTPLALAIKNQHQAATILLTQLGADLRVPVVYVPKMSVETPDAKYWMARKEKIMTQKIVSKPAIQVVIQHEWRNVMPLMFFQLLDKKDLGDFKMETDVGEEFHFASVVEAACRVPDFETVLVLIRRQKDSSELKRVNDDGQTLLHILAINSGNNEPQIKDIAVMLIKRGVELDVTDTFGISALHYAAYNKCDVLVQEILRAAGHDAPNLVNIYDNLNRTPATALFWNRDANDASSVRILTDLAAGYGDMASALLGQPTSLPKQAELDILNPKNRIDFFQKPDESTYYSITPLMRAIYGDCSRIIDKLLEIGVDINCQVEANGNLTAIMLAVECNNLSVVRRLLEADIPVLLSNQDDNCRTVLHHVTRPAKWGYWENSEILKLLIEKGASISDEDVHGKSALDYALEGGSGRLSGVLQELLNVAQEQRESPKALSTPVSDEIDFGYGKPNFIEDSAAILQKINEDEGGASKPAPEVDALSGMMDWGQIIEDLTTGLHGDVLLSEIEVKGNGDFYQNFTRMQIIGHKLKKQFVLFTRSGRVGEEGDWKITPFTIPENAIREFMKLYKIKTGNEWTSLPDFRRCTKKHALVPFDLMNRIPAADLEFDLEADSPSKLSQPVQELFRELTQVSCLKEVVKQSILDHGIMPFGRLVRPALEAGVNLLFDIRDLIIASNEAKKGMTNVLDINRMQWFLEQAMSLTFEFNKNIPHPGQRIDRIKILSDLAEIDDKIAKSRNLLKLEFANNLLLAAQYRINDANPIDYVYKSLDCTVLPLVRTSDESHAILKYIEDSGCESKVTQIFKCYRASEVNDLANCGVGRHKLLWLPASISDILYTMANGITVPCPQGRKKDANRYRKALDQPDDDPKTVFYEMFQDIIDLCVTFSTEQKYAFLCQVALGKPKEMAEIPTQRPEGVYNSIKISGRDAFANDDHELITPEGASISLGKRSKQSSASDSSNVFPSNRHVIYNDTKQVSIRYLVRFAP